MPCWLWLVSVAITQHLTSQVSKQKPSFVYFSSKWNPESSACGIYLTVQSTKRVHELHNFEDQDVVYLNIKYLLKVFMFPTTTVYYETDKVISDSCLVNAWLFIFLPKGSFKNSYFFENGEPKTRKSQDDLIDQDASEYVWGRLGPTLQRNVLKIWPRYFQLDKVFHKIAAGGNEARLVYL